MTPRTITDEQLVDLVESLRDVEHGLTFKRLRVNVILRYGIRATGLRAQAEALHEDGRLFVGREQPIGLGHHVVYPADYRATYERRLAESTTEPADRQIPLPPNPTSLMGVAQ